MVARWEFWAVANMLVSTHGELAEIHADEQIARARAAGDAGDEIAWRAIADKIKEIRSGDTGSH